jgi:hypothetical protein
MSTRYPLPPVNIPPSVALGPEAILVAAHHSDLPALQTDDERALLALIDGKRTVAEILRVSRLSGFVAMRQLRSLSERRLIRPVQHRVHTSPPAPSQVRAINRLRPERGRMTQDLTSVAESFTEPAFDTPTPLPVVPKITRELAPLSAPRALLPISPAISSPPRLGAMAMQAVDLWFSLAKRDWSTLVVIPAHRLGSAVPLACALAEAGSALRRRPVQLLSAEGKDLVPTTEWIFPRGADDQHGRVIALEPVSVNPMGIPVAQAAGAVLLVAERGVADMATIRRTVETIGRRYFVGSVLISPKR